MKVYILCTLMMALYNNVETKEVVSAELEVNGILVKEYVEYFVVDFSEDVQRLPIVGSPQNYSRVKIKKNKCGL